jgi:hypothetical protein
MLTTDVGSGVTPRANDAMVVTTMPMSSAPCTRCTSSHAVTRKPRMASSVPGLVMLPSATGDPGTPSATTPTAFNPMKVRKRPMPTAKLCLSERGIALASQLRTRNTVRIVKSTPARKIAPNAVCQGNPMPFTTVKAMKAFSPM